MTSEELRKQSIAAYKAGRRAQARELLLKALQMDRHNEQTWLWLSAVADTDAERRVCLEEVLVLNPPTRRPGVGWSILELWRTSRPRGRSLKRRRASNRSRGSTLPHNQRSGRFHRLWRQNSQAPPGKPSVPRTSAVGCSPELSR